MSGDDSGLPSTVPESINAFAQFAQPPLPQAATHTGNASAPKRMSNEGGGDDATQEVSQDFYDQHIEKSRSRLAPARDNNETQHTLFEGDEGHIDIVSSFVGNDGPMEVDAETQDVAIDFSPTQDQTQPNHQPFSESQRFKTPATAGKKRLYNGDTKETPSLPRAPVLRSGSRSTPGMNMRLSQAFADTQAQTSPFLNGTQNPRSDRPSPNIDLDQRPATAPLSSPLRMIKSVVRTSSAEPASRYIPMEESQRRRQEEKDRLLAEEEDEVDSDSSFDKPDTQARNWQRDIRKRDREARDRYRGQTTSSVTPPQKSRRKVSLPRSAVATQRRSSHSPPITVPMVQVLPTTPGRVLDEEDLAPSEAETEQEDEDTLIQRSSQRSLVDPEDKENLESAVQIPQTSARRTRIETELMDSVQVSPSLRQHQQPPSSAGPLVPNTQISQRASQRPLPHTSATSGVDFIPQSQDTAGQPQGSSYQSQNLLSSSRNDVEAGPDVVGIGEMADQEESNNAFKRRQPGDSVDNDDVEPREAPQLKRERRGEVGNSYEAEAASHVPTLMHSSTHESHRHTVSETEASRSAAHQTSHSRAEQETSNPTQTNLETAPSAILPESKAQPASSPPMNTPRRKSKRLSQIWSEVTPVQERWSQNFDPVSALGMDFDMGVLDDQSPIGPGKRRKRLQQTSREAPETASVGLKAHVRPKSPESGISGPDELLASQPAVRAERAQRSTRSTAQIDGRDAVWDIGATPFPSAKTPVLKPSKRQLRSRSGMARQDDSDPNTVPNPEAVQDDNLSEASSEDQQPKQTQTPKRTPSKDKRQARQPSVESSNSEHPSETYRTAPTDELIAPNTVFACFNGKTRAYYPAWCIGRGSTDQHYTIQWDGYAPDEVDVYGVRSLDLHIGDQVKVDMKGVPKVSHVIRGFKDKVEGDELSQTITDQRGFKTVLVAPKQRKSLPADVSTENDREVPISNIYLDINMWVQMKDRVYAYSTPVQSVDVSGYATPIEQASTPTTPTSRHRRQADVAPTSTVQQTNGLFKGMVFAVSYEDADRRRGLNSLIWTNGGRIVGDDGFGEIFEPDSMALKPKYAASAFTALLADKHSRKPKYLQALALGLPCLSGQWIEASMQKQQLLDWRHYLLPAGECDRLDGATKSRIVPYIDAHEANLASQLASRGLPLESEKVVVIASRGKTEAKVKNHLFFIRAMGAQTLEKATDVRAAKDLLEGYQGFGLVYVEKKLEAVEAALLTGAGRGGRKKAGGGAEAKWVVAEMESVVQSLIFGARVD